MRLLALSLLSLFPAFSLASPVAEALAEPEPQAVGSAPQPGQVSIQSVTWGGSGCKMGQNGDTAFVFSSDYKTITLIYSNYIASTGPGPTSILLSRRNCLINIKVNVPRFWVYTLSTTIFRGYQQLGKSCMGKISAVYSFSGFTPQVEGSYTWMGNQKGYKPNSYTQSTQVKAYWPPCNEPTMLNIDSSAVVSCSNINDAALLTVDQTDQKFTQIYQLLWQPCFSKL